MLDLVDTLIEKILATGWIAPPAVPAFSFLLPDDGFRKALAGPTLNVYLAEVRENRDFRRSQFDTIIQADRSAVLAQPPAWFDCHYLISAWSPVQANEIAPPTAEEHALLGGALRILLRNPDVVPGALGVIGGGPVFSDGHVYLALAAPDTPRVLNDFWSTMKQPWRPVISLVATAPLDPRSESPSGPPLITFVQRCGIVGTDPAGFDEIVQIGGWVLRQADDQPIAGASVVRVATGEDVHTDALGRFSFSGLAPGIHRFRASAPNQAPLERDLDVPAGPPEDHVFRLG